MARDFSQKFYKSREWKRVRENILRRDNYLCRECGKPAQEIHHIIHLTPDNINNKEIAVGEDNLISLCRGCHFNEHRACRGVIHVDKGYTFDEDGYIIQGE